MRRNPAAIAPIAVPLVIQTFLIFFLGYGWARAWKVPYEVAAPEEPRTSSSWPWR